MVTKKPEIGARVEEPGSETEKGNQSPDPNQIALQGISEMAWALPSLYALWV